VLQEDQALIDKLTKIRDYFSQLINWLNDPEQKKDLRTLESHIRSAVTALKNTLQDARKLREKLVSLRRETQQEDGLERADDNVDRQEESIDRLEEKIDSDPSLSKVPDQRVQELQAEIKRGEKIIEGQEEQVEKEEEAISKIDRQEERAEDQLIRDANSDIDKIAKCAQGIEPLAEGKFANKQEALDKLSLAIKELNHLIENIKNDEHYEEEIKEITQRKENTERQVLEQETQLSQEEQQLANKANQLANIVSSDLQSGMEKVN